MKTIKKRTTVSFSSRFYLSFRRRALSRWGAWAAPRRNVSLFPPNYACKEPLNPGDTLIDVGTADNPDLSLYMIDTYGVNAFAVDPTPRYRDCLSRLTRTKQRFHFVPVAVGAQDGMFDFFESQDNASGSLSANHRNVIFGETRNHQVETLTLDSLLQRIDRKRVAFLKLDIEGAEYEVLARVSQSTLECFGQILVEFHHHCIAGRSLRDTQSCIMRIRSLGMTAFPYNGHDCLFYWK